MAASTRKRRGPLFFLTYGLYLVSILAAVDYLAFWRPFVAELRERQKPKRPTLESLPHVDALTMSRLGTVSSDRATSFVHFPTSKPEGTVRLCTFGDSFTHGDEVADGHDYPAFLQAQLRQRGRAPFEVINFGSGWHGFQQAYMMWDAVGSQFDCDYVLLGPRCFQADRDVRMNHTSLGSPYFIHARYVLDGDDVRLIDIPGTTHAERFDAYYAFVPGWDFLRFDRNAPAAIQAVLPAGTTRRNPFYYTTDTEVREAMRIDRVLLNRMAARARQVVLLHDAPSVIDVARSLPATNLKVARSYSTDAFPYRAPDGHYSAFGNQLVAAQYVALLTADEHAQLTVLQSGDAAGADAPPFERRQPLSSFARIEVALEGQPIAFVVPQPTTWLVKAVGSASQLSGGPITALLGIKQPSAGWLDAAYVPLDFALDEGMAVVLKVGSDPAARVFDLGSVHSLAANLNLGGIEIEDIRVARGGLTFEGNSHIPRAALGPPGTVCELQVAGRTVARGQVGPQYLLMAPVLSDLHLFRVPAGRFIDVGLLPESGQFEVLFTDTDASLHRLPIATWKKVRVASPQFESKLPPPQPAAP